jgi:O-succinylhomoserine sulfhydrylase
MQKHSENAQALAEALDGHASLVRVKYPFLKSHPQYDLAKRQMKYGGGILTLDIKGGFEKVVAFSKALKIASISPNLGDSRTIITHPSSTTHAKIAAEEKVALGITDGLVRVAVGLESIEDLKADFLQALNVIQ